jgi:predicted metal-dependent peptidase
MSKELRDKVTAARAVLSREHPYMAPVAMRLPIVITSKLPQGVAAAVDERGRIYLDEARCSAMPVRQLSGVVTHEILHFVLDHFGRLDNRDRMQWNVAADVLINEMVRAFGFDLPDGLCERGPMGVPADLRSAEAVYDWLQQQPQQGGGKGNACGTGTDLGDAVGDAAGIDGMDPVDADMARAEVAAGAVRAKEAGNVPAGLGVWADEKLGPPKENWRARLAGLLSRSCNTFVRGRQQSDWTRFGRRSEGVGFRLPGRVEPKPRVAVVIDTSGSMWGNGGKVLSEAMGIVAAAGAAVDMLSCDAAAGKVVAVERLRDLQPALVGGGGTDLQPAVDALAPVTQYAAIVVFTDGYLPPVTVPPGPRVIWAITPDGVVCDWMTGAVIKMRAGS